METLTKSEKTFFKKLNTPQKVQDFLDSIPFNFEKKGETLMSPRRVINEKKAHCIEGALFAAAALMYHGRPPLLLDLKTIGLPYDYDHVVALFQENGRWGAISKTNHAVLRYRDPVYKTVRELAMSYFHEYFLYSGKKTLRSYSRPFRLRKSGGWVVDEDDLWEIETALDESSHVDIAPSATMKKLRNATKFERAIVERTEW